MGRPQHNSGVHKLLIVGSIGAFLGWVLGETAAKSVFDLYIYYGFLAAAGSETLWNYIPNLTSGT